MNRQDLVDGAAKAAGISKKQAKDAVDSVFAGIPKTLKKGDSVQLVGFGSFSVKKRKARKGRNPQTGAAIKIAAKKVLAFSAESELKKAVK